MIRHIVMWKLKPEAEGRTAKENAQWMKEHLEGLLGVVPQLVECEVGINVVEGNYDAVLAPYHDQGLIPLKLVDFHTAVNVTLGLPIIRASVDHGTGFGHAGDGHANELSLVNAMDYGIRMANAKAKP